MRRAPWWSFCVGLGVWCAVPAQAAPAKPAHLHWIALPVMAERTPPKDPTLLRMSTALAQTIHESIGIELHVATREQRDEACGGSDGCPIDVASILEADRVIELSLSDKLDELTVKIFRKPRGLVVQGKAPCTWTAGEVACDAKRVVDIISGLEAPPRLDANAVRSAFLALRPELERCWPEGKGEPAPKSWVRFRAFPEGRVSDVRLGPKKLQRKAPYACMARAIEALKIPAFHGKARAFRFDLAEAFGKKARKRR